MRFLKIALKKAIVIESLKVAIVVGTILNLINQWEAITTFRFENMQWLKLIFTFCVPYLVSTYASVVTEIRNSD